MTHTYALLEVSQQAFDEIKKLLEEADYYHAVTPEGYLDMNGIALQRGVPKSNENTMVVVRQDFVEEMVKRGFAISPPTDEEYKEVILLLRTDPDQTFVDALLKVRETKKQMREAGDRRDWDECDRLERELKGEE